MHALAALQLAGTKVTLRLNCAQLEMLDSMSVRQLLTLAFQYSIELQFNHCSTSLDIHLQGKDPCNIIFN